MIQKAIKRLAELHSDLIFVIRFILSESGAQYTVGILRKIWLIKRVIENNRRIRSLSTWKQHLILIEEMLNIPKDLNGDVIECGCYYGASTASLSLVCHLTGRMLFVCDSFEGLPNVEEGEKYDINSDSSEFYIWEEGEFSSDLERVKKNVLLFGAIDSCKFIKGFFENTLPRLDIDSIVLIFEDADLASSVKSCLLYLWPKLRDGCKFFCHEPWSTNVVALFFDSNWWRKNLDRTAPGFCGSGGGVIAGAKYSLIGYSKKINVEKVKKRGKKKMHLGSKRYQESGG